jgi:hypothetical protein
MNEAGAKNGALAFPVEEDPGRNPVRWPTKVWLRALQTLCGVWSASAGYVFAGQQIANVNAAWRTATPWQ